MPQRPAEKMREGAIEWRSLPGSASKYMVTTLTGGPFSQLESTHQFANDAKIVLSTFTDSKCQLKVFFRR